MIDTETSLYDAFQCAVFRRSKDRHGELSNMTGGYPLSYAGVRFQSPEGLYQALKYPDNHDLQRAIGACRSGMDAKRYAYASAAAPREGWDALRVEAMALTLALKLAQHPERFGRALRATGRSPVVESSARDPFWGARPAGQTLNGANALGKLLTRLRDLLLEEGDPMEAAARFRQEARSSLAGKKVPGGPLTIAGECL